MSSIPFMPLVSCISCLGGGEIDPDAADCWQVSEQESVRLSAKCDKRNLMYNFIF